VLFELVDDPLMAHPGVHVYSLSRTGHDDLHETLIL
jgi:hypothetical protein